MSILLPSHKSCFCRGLSSNPFNWSIRLDNKEVKLFSRLSERKKFTVPVTARLVQGSVPTGPTRPRDRSRIFTEPQGFTHLGVAPTDKQDSYPVPKDTLTHPWTHKRTCPYPFSLLFFPLSVPLTDGKRGDEPCSIIINRPLELYRSGKEPSRRLETKSS